MIVVEKYAVWLVTMALTREGAHFIFPYEYLAAGKSFLTWLITKSSPMNATTTWEPSWMAATFLTATPTL